MSDLKAPATAADDPSPPKIAVIGAGVIGTSVAFACLSAGYPVVLVDRPDRDWTAVRSALRQEQRRARLSKTGADVDLARITVSSNLADVAGSRVVVENVTEDRTAKTEVYRALSAVDLPDAVIAANTSAIPIGWLAGLVPDAARVVGVHFMNPVAAIDVVEVIRAPATSDATLAATQAFLAGLGKTGVVVNDSPGFVINRILMVMVNQAAQLLDDGVATAHQVDQLFRGCLGHRMGPLRTADLIGLDTIVNTLRVLGEAGQGPMTEPADGLVSRVREGRLGIKTGRGFYEYSAGR